ncbi:asparaginase domain-containing protein [Desulfosarcina sp. OttesenSCG-928-A07]|nr:asparaginase domain-containing protein [Desulfosarcina sp. OttesenSCG-928-G17]MDL2328153.1 asparaginase domain-containing protein [Desulfosarcina sp. OttesenSCG-928-A07]
MEKRKLSIIFTGGTIAMVEGEDHKLRPPKDPREFAKALPQLFSNYLISMKYVLNKDSTDMRPGDWEKIVQAVHEELARQPDGIVVVHGVDTICFSASATAYALGPGLSLPVVFTGAQLPSNKVFGDAMANLTRSAEVATHPDSPPEVMVLFNTMAFRATRAQKKDDKAFDAVESPAFPPLVTVKEPLERSSRSDRRRPKKGEAGGSGLSACMNRFSTGILPIILSPGNLPQLFEMAIEKEPDRCKGIILFSFGGATIPNVEKDESDQRLPENDERYYSYLPLIKKAYGHCIPLLIASHYPTIATSADLYESGSAAQDAGAIPVGGYVLPSLVSKFSWILAHTEHLRNDMKIRNTIIEKLMKSPYVGEIGETDFTTSEFWASLREPAEQPSENNRLSSSTA